MTSDSDRNRDLDDSLLDRALDGGFQPAKDQPQPGDQPGSLPSVIQHIAKLTGMRPSIALRDVPGDITPMLKPLAKGDGSIRDAGKYSVHGMLGQGGVGSVHKAHDQDLGRDVAIKFLHEKYQEQPAILHRFVEEAQIGGQLQHPGIVPVYEFGLAGKRPFFTMKLVKGQTLAQKLAERRSPAQDRRTFLAIFEDVCQTMAYAHARGVVHRDLKPANIMIGNFGEVQVVDWGMGKVLARGGIADEQRAAALHSQLSVIETLRSSGHGTQSVLGSVMGTPAYMPPEQARGDVEQMDERSDVFALGAMLCEILTGQPPYVGAFEELLGMAAMAKLDDANARLQNCGAEQDLVELCRQCLLPAPAARPRSAEVVAKAIHDHLAAAEQRVHDAKVEAAEAKVRATSLKRMQKLGIALTTTIAAGLAVSLYFWNAADTAAANERDARLEAMASAAEAKENEQRATEQTEVAERELTRALAIKQLITKMLQSVTPEQAQGADITLLRGILDVAAKRLEDGAIHDEQVAGELHMLTGNVYRSLGLHAEAERHLPVAVELSERELGEEHPHTLASMGNLASLYSNQGRYAEAEPLFLQTLEIRRRVLGQEHPDTLLSMGNLASLYLHQSRFDEAETLGLQTLEIRRRVLGQEHPDTLLSMGNLASLYLHQSRFDEAETLGLQTLELEQRVLGQEHKNTLGTITNLGLLYNAMERFEDAAAQFEISLPIKRRVLGMQHPWTGFALNGLITAYLKLGRTEDALPLQREQLEQKYAAAQAADASTRDLNNFAWDLLTQKTEGLRDPARALALAQRACAREEAEGGDQLWLYLDTLALAQHETGATATALATQQRALALMPANANAATAKEMKERRAQYEAAQQGESR